MNGKFGAECSKLKVMQGANLFSALSKKAETRDVDRSKTFLFALIRLRTHPYACQNFPLGTKIHGHTHPFLPRANES